MLMIWLRGVRVVKFVASKHICWLASESKIQGLEFRSSKQETEPLPAQAAVAAELASETSGWEIFAWFNILTNWESCSLVN